MVAIARSFLCLVFLSSLLFLIYTEATFWLGWCLIVSVSPDNRLTSGSRKLPTNISNIVGRGQHSSPFCPVPRYNTPAAYSTSPANQSGSFVAWQKKGLCCHVSHQAKNTFQSQTSLTLRLFFVSFCQRLCEMATENWKLACSVCNSSSPLFLVLMSTSLPWRHN